MKMERLVWVGWGISMREANTVEMGFRSPDMVGPFFGGVLVTMAASKSAARMGYWREFFKTSNGDIFETIEKAIMIAASDYPKEFGIRRDLFH
ncbi:hypothetical protein R6Q59_025671 [Mikania micrantha]